VVRAMALGDRKSFAEYVLKALRVPGTVVVRHPALVLLLLRLGELLLPLLARCRRYLAERKAIGVPGFLGTPDIDFDLIQGCLISAENLLNLGRIEKRTLFQISAKKVLGGNAHLMQVLRASAMQCHRNSHNCLVPRWIPAEERYHILQASLNAVSSLFGENYVHQNALGETEKHLFKSTWYCVTLMTPTRPENKTPSEKNKIAATSSSMETCTFTDMTRTPRPTLRICIVNESEIRAIADGKLRPPSWGFFNSRHAERYRMLGDFCRNFQKQLVRTPADSRGMSSRSPFTSEKAHQVQKVKPDGGLMKRVQSQPSLAAQSLGGNMSSMGQGNPPAGQLRGRGSSDADAEDQREEQAQGVSDENCFLRLHVPHFAGHHIVPKHVIVNEVEEQRGMIGMGVSPSKLKRDGP